MRIKSLSAIAFAAALMLLAALPPACRAAEILGPDVKVSNQSIQVQAEVRLDDNQVGDIKKGMPKEIVIYVDLFRVWPYWADEFVLGRAITRTVRCDPVRKEYVATSLLGSVLTEKRFTDCEGLLRWALRVEGLKLSSTAELEPADYFVSVSAEGRIRKLPPFINHLFFFVREREFRVRGDSPYFPLNQ